MTTALLRVLLFVLVLVFLFFVLLVLVFLVFFFVIVVVCDVLGRGQRNRRDRLPEQVAFFAKPDAFDVLVADRGHRHRLAAGFQEYDIAGLERHGLSSRL